jgi:hypothetical protein
MPLNTSTPECLYYGLLSSSEADLATVGAAELWIATQIEVTNTDSSERTFTLKSVPDGDTTGDQHLIGFGKAMTIGATPKVYRATGRWVLPASGKLRGFASAASVVVVRIDGIKVTTT